jgi:hypothetical protein
MRSDALDALATMVNIRIEARGGLDALKIDGLSTETSRRYEGVSQAVDALDGVAEVVVNSIDISVMAEIDGEDESSDGSDSDDADFSDDPDDAGDLDLGFDLDFGLGVFDIGS